MMQERSADRLWTLQSSTTCVIFVKVMKRKVKNMMLTSEERWGAPEGDKQAKRVVCAADDV